MGRDYLTVPEELLEQADAVADWFEDHGYSVRVEHSEVEYPYTPTLRCRRHSMTVLVEVDRRPSLERLMEWTRYARSCQRDTRIAVAIPATARTLEDDGRLREAGIGLYVVEGVPNVATEVMMPRDLAVNVELPMLSRMPKKLQRVLGPVYEHFERAQWREGFEEACLALETHARKYLAREMINGRITLVTTSGLVSKTTAGDVPRLTLGGLATAFAQIQVPNHADSVVGQVLARINKDRVGVAHYKRTAAAEERLRRNVGQHMWRVVAALRELLGVKD